MKYIKSIIILLVVVLLSAYLYKIYDDKKKEGKLDAQLKELTQQIDSLNRQIIIIDSIKLETEKSIEISKDKLEKIEIQKRELTFKKYSDQEALNIIRNYFKENNIPSR